MNRLSLPHRIALTGALICLVMGIFVLAGWWFDIPFFRSFLEQHGYMKANTALAFVLIGVCFWLAIPGPLEGGAKTLAWGFVLTVGCLGGLTLGEYYTGRDFGIDQILVRDYLHTGATAAGRMSLNTATALLLVAAGMGLLLWPSGANWPAMTAGLIACLIASLAIFSASGMFLELPTSYEVAGARQMSFRTAVGLLLLAVSFLALAHERSRLGGQLVVRWLPFAVTIGVFSLSILMWQAVRLQERNQIRATVQRARVNVERLLSGEIQARVLTLLRMRQRWQTRGLLDEVEWQYESRLFLSHYPDLKLIAKLDARARLQWLTGGIRQEVPATFQPAESPEVARLLEEARASGEARVTAIHAAGGPDAEFMVLLSVPHEGEPAGYVVVVFQVRPLVEELLAEIFQGFHLRIREGEQVVYARVNDEQDGEPWLQSGQITVDRRHWRMEIWPRRSTLRELRSVFAGGLVGGGGGLALLLGLAIHLAQTSRQQAFETRGINRRLAAEVRERQQIQTALRHSQERLQAILDNTLAVIYLKDLEGRYLLVNRQFESLFHVSKEEMMGRTDLDVFPRELAENFRANDQRVAREQRALTLEEVAPHDDGQHTYVSIKFPMLDAEGRVYGVCGISTDITDRKRAEARLHENHEALARARDRLRGIIEGTSDQVVALDLRYSFMAFNSASRRAFQTRYGVEIQEGMRIAEALRNEAGGLQRTFDLWTRALQGEEFKLEEERRLPEGGTAYHEISFSPILTEAGDLLGSTQVTRDISDRRRAENERNKLVAELASRNEQLLEANRELEAFSYSVSHDLRAPLRHIDGFAGLLLRDAGQGLDEKSARYVRLISDAARKMGRLIDDLLAFSRIARAEIQRVPVDMNRLTAEVRTALEPDCAGRRIDWRCQELPPVAGDPAMLRQVLVNLLANAVKYTGPREQAVIEIGSRNGDPAETQFYVRDNGVGFDMKYVNSLFGVFQRLHRADQFEGTGIGLANVRRIVARHGGRTWAEGRVDEGATFWFALPCVSPDRREDLAGDPVLQPDAES